MRQPIFGGSSDPLSNAATEFNYIYASEENTWNGSTALRLQEWPGNGKLHTFRVKISAAPGGGGTYTFTIVVNGSDTALQVAITDPGTTGVSFSEITVAAGNNIRLKCTPTGSPSATPTAVWSMIYEDTDNINRSVLLGAHGNLLDNTLTERNYLAGGKAWAVSIVGREAPNALVTVAGTLRNFYVELNGSPGAGNNYAFHVLVNGSPPGPVVTISGTAVSGNDTSNTASIVVGDRVALRCTPSSTPSTRRARWGICFDSDTAGQSMILGGTDDFLNFGTTEYNYLAGTGHIFTTTESSFRVQGEMSFLRNLYIRLNTAPTTGNSYTFTVYINGSPSALTTVIADTDIIGSNFTDIVEVKDGDVISLEVDPTGTPVSLDLGWGATLETLNPFPDSLKLVGHGI